MITVKLTRIQAGLMALEEAPYLELEVVRRCGAYVWIQGSREDLEQLATAYQQACDRYTEAVAWHAIERIRAELGRAGLRS